MIDGSIIAAAAGAVTTIVMLLWQRMRNTPSKTMSDVDEGPYRTNDTDNDTLLPAIPLPNGPLSTCPQCNAKAYECSYCSSSGCYFPDTDFNDMGGRGTGIPADVEWLDSIDDLPWAPKVLASKETK